MTTSTQVSIGRNAKIILEKRYLKKDKEGNVIETIPELFKRVATAIAKAEKQSERTTWKNAFYEQMTSGKFLPNSPTMMNAGINGTLSACFVIGIEDSMTSILEASRVGGLVLKYGGGTGYSLSKIRSKGIPIRSTHGRACGPIAVLHYLDSLSKMITQGGKRNGANMGILEVSHPDILEFIHCKDDWANNGGKDGSLSDFNISVGITDKFMEAVRDNTDFNLIDPSTKQIIRTVQARKLFAELVESAWKTGDPGLVFLDEINRKNKTPQLGRLESTNPCVTKDTWIMTSEGPRQVEDLLDKSFETVINGKSYPTTNFFSTGIKPILKITTTRGQVIKVTKNHKLKLLINNFEIWTEAQHLKPGFKLELTQHDLAQEWGNKDSFEEGWLTGSLVGDGWLPKYKERIAYKLIGESVGSGYLPKKNEIPAYIRYFGDNKIFLARQAHQFVNTLGTTQASFGERVGTLEEVNEREYIHVSAKALTTMARKNLTSDKQLRPSAEKYSSDFARGYLQGFFDADGCASGNSYTGFKIRLAQSDLERLETVQRMLGRFGILSTIYKNKQPEQMTLMPDRHGGMKPYLTKAKHELVISGFSILTFYVRVGFSDPDKQAKVSKNITSKQRRFYQEKYFTKIEKIEELSPEEVFDCTVDEVHMYDTNGLLSHNCGEVPLYPNEACNLASINLGKFWNFKEEKIEYEELDETVEVVTRFLDNVVTVNEFPIPEIEEAVAKTRKIGLGVMGWADLLIYAGIPYESQEALDLAEKIMSDISSTANKVSLDLGKERGPYPAYDERYDKPYRNATRTCMAPTGTISRIAGASSGIEPLYALAFESFILDGEKLQDLSESFEKYTGYTQEDELVTRIIKNKGSIKGLGHEELEEVLKTALEIEPIWHIRHQAVFQKFTDLAVSKTINLPETATIEDIQDVYIQAHQTNCKGITVYRAGSRDQEVLNAGKKTSKVKKLKKTSWGADANSFPVPTPDGLSMRITVVKDDAEIPREVFIIIGKSGHDLQADMEAIGRLCSLALRYDIPLREVWGQLVGIKSDRSAYHENRPIESYPDGIALALEEYLEKAGLIKSDTIDENGNLTPGVKELINLYESNHAICPDCKNPLIYEEGCQKCSNGFCGFSKC